MYSSIARSSQAQPGRKIPIDLVLLIGVALWVLMIGWGLREPWPADEPRFALIGRDIVETGRWFIPHRGPELYAEKPPIFLWMQATAYAITGGAGWSFLLPSLFAALGTLALVFDLSRRLYGRRIAWLATAALLITVQFTLQARTAQIDAVLCFFTTLGLYGLLRHLLLGPAWGWYAIAGIATGLGVITKGTGFLPWLLMIPYVWARLRGMYGLAKFPGGLRWSIGPLLLLLTIALWALPILYLAAQPGNEEIAAYRDDLLFRQTLTRYVAAWHHHKPFWYFIVNVIPVLWLPGSLLLYWAIPAWRRRIKRGDARTFMLLGWVLLVLLFFSLSPGKRGVYILPAVPALALLFAPLLPGLLVKRSVQRALAILTALVGALLILGAGWALLLHPSFAQRIELQNSVTPWWWVLSVGVAGVLAALLLRKRGAVAFVVLMTSAWTGYGLWGYPSMDAARSGAGLMRAVAARLPAESALGLVGAPEQLLLQARGNVQSFGFKTPLQQQRENAMAWLAQSAQHWLLLQHPQRDTCVIAAQTIDMGWANRRHWFLVPHAALQPGCQLSITERTTQ
jgi:4-amino-4-deoxy-L-arabinose transferase-like glycosyltransferase